ncbi:hypothetical protein D3C72_990690 [compost metagenome]
MAKRKHHAKSTVAEAQRIRALDALRTGAKTTYDLRRLGLYQAPARIKELRSRGYEITTTPVQITDADGFTHDRVAMYTLVSEPEKEGRHEHQ